MITKNDLKVIKECLAASGVKNSEFEQLDSIPKDDDAYIALVYKGKNYKIRISDLKFVNTITWGDETLIPDEQGNLTISLEDLEIPITIVKFGGSNFPNASTTQIKEGDYFYHSYSNTLHQWNQGWHNVPWTRGFYYIYKNDKEALYVYTEELGVKEIGKDKQDKLISSQNIKTINGEPILGRGDITIDVQGTTTRVSDILPIDAITDLTFQAELDDNLYEEEGGIITYDPYTHIFYLYVGENDAKYPNWTSDPNGRASSEDYAAAQFVYLKYNSNSKIVAVYKVTEDGLVNITSKDTPFIRADYWVGNVADLSEIYSPSFGQYTVCGNRIYRYDRSETWIEVGPKLNSDATAENPVWIISYGENLYKLERMDSAPVRILSGTENIEESINSSIQELQEQSEGNTTSISNIREDISDIQGNVSTMNQNITSLTSSVEFLNAGIKLLWVDDILPSNLVYETVKNVVYEWEPGYGEQTDDDEAVYEGGGGRIVMHPGNITQAPRILLAVERVGNDQDVETTEVVYYGKWTTLRAPTIHSDDPTGRIERYSSEVYDLDNYVSNTAYYIWYKNGAYHIGIPDFGTIKEVSPVDTAFDLASTRAIANNVVASFSKNISTTVGALKTEVSHITKLESTKLLPFDQFGDPQIAHDQGRITVSEDQEYTGEGGQVVINPTIPRCELWVDGPGDMDFFAYLNWSKKGAERKSSAAYANLKDVILWTIDDGDLRLYRCSEPNEIIEVSGQKLTDIQNTIQDESQRLDTANEMIEWLRQRVAALDGNTDLTPNPDPTF